MADRGPDAAVVGPHVIVSLRAAAAWAPVLRREIRRAAANGESAHPFVRDVVEAFETAAGFASETKRAKPEVVSSEWGSHSLTVAQVADLANVTDQAVRKAARSGRLPGRRVGKSWIFEREDVTVWVGRRSA